MDKEKAIETAIAIAGKLSSVDSGIDDGTFVYDFCYRSALEMWEAVRAFGGKAEKESEVRRLNNEIAKEKNEAERERLRLVGELNERMRAMRVGFLDGQSDIDQRIGNLQNSLTGYDMKPFSELTEEERYEKNCIITEIGDLKRRKALLKERFIAEMETEKERIGAEIAKNAYEARIRILALKERKGLLLDEGRVDES